MDLEIWNSLKIDISSKDSREACKLISKGLMLFQIQMDLEIWNSLKIDISSKDSREACKLISKGLMLLQI